MKKLLIITFFLFLFCITFSCQQGERVFVETKADVKADIQAINDIAEKWETAINSGDIDTIMSFYSDDAVKVPPNEPAIAGKEAIRSGYQKLFEVFTHEEEHEIVAIHVGGNLAFTNTTWSLIATPIAGGVSKKTNGNWIRIFRKQTDGTWQVIYMMWSDEGLVSPTQAE